MLLIPYAKHLLGFLWHYINDAPLQMLDREIFEPDLVSSVQKPLGLLVKAYIWDTQKHQFLFILKKLVQRDFVYIESAVIRAVQPS